MSITCVNASAASRVDPDAPALRLAREAFEKAVGMGAEAVIEAGRTPGVLFQAWFEVMIALITMFSLPIKRG